MFCNADATLYHMDENGDWIKTYYSKVYWYDKISTIAEKTGIVTKQQTIIYIPFSGTTAPAVKTGIDFIVKGLGPDIDNSSEQTQSQSLKSLMPIDTIKTYCPCLFGSESMHHLELVVY